jgi:hypothetical protein
MAKLTGTAPSQVPTNADLGDLAYQDGDNAIIGPISIVDGDVAVDTDKLFVDTANNRVGIGTSAPLRTLHLQDVGADASAQIRMQNDARIWDLGLVGGAGDSFIIRDSTGGNDVFRIDAGTPAGSLFLKASGDVGIATTSPTQKLDVNDDSIRVRTAKTPSSASDTGTAGQIAWDANYIYVCTATDTWKRVAIATW